MTAKEKVIHIRKIFNEIYKDAKCSLVYSTPIELLVATQLSAQCTDARVNIVTKDLFQKYKSVDDFANASQSELEQDIKSTGFYRNKAKNIIACCKTIIREFDRKVPNNIDDLLKLSGVGRKTANLILGEIYNIPSIVVDTHCMRLSHRIGLTKAQNPTKIEFELMKILPKDYYTQFCHQLVWHGREICDARKPKCNNCKIHNYCSRVNVKNS